MLTKSVYVDKKGVCCVAKLTHTPAFLHKNKSLNTKNSLTQACMSLRANCCDFCVILVL